MAVGGFCERRKMRFKKWYAGGRPLHPWAGPMGREVSLRWAGSWDARCSGRGLLPGAAPAVVELDVQRHSAPNDGPLGRRHQHADLRQEGGAA